MSNKRKKNGEKVLNYERTIEEWALYCIIVWVTEWVTLTARAVSVTGAVPYNVDLLTFGEERVSVEFL
jgi:hypothetical protein